MKTMRWLALTLVCCLALTASRWSQAADTAVQEKKDAPAAEATNAAVVPAFHKGTTARHEKINDRAKQGDVDLLFLGDSITEGWAGGGKNVWEKYYGKRKPMNAGVGGDRTEHVLWRMDNGNIDGIHPKLTVIMIGTNNSGGKEYTAENIGDGIKAIVNEVRAKLPESKILLLGIFPRGATSDAQLEKAATNNGKKQVDAADMPARVTALREATMQQRHKNAKASEIASQLADDKMIFYMDIGDKFLEADGTLPDDVMPDHLHPNEKGYEIWASAIEPKVSELLGEKK